MAFYHGTPGVTSEELTRFAIERHPWETFEAWQRRCTAADRRAVTSEQWTSAHPDQKLGDPERGTARMLMHEDGATVLVPVRVLSDEDAWIAGNECAFCGDEYDPDEHRVCPTCGPSFEHAAEQPPHSRDEQCTVDERTGCCLVCGVDHDGDPCLDCGARAFHRAGCPALRS